MIPLFSVNVPESVDQPLLETLHSGYITQGPKVEEFEQLLKEYFNSLPITVNSGTSALTLALRLAGIGSGDEVITTAMTCSATNLPILSLGGVPVWADVYPDTGLIDPKSVKDKITKKTKAIMAVDWGGLPADRQWLRAIADQYGLKLIIDSAHSFGAPHTANSVADFECFSFQAIKHFTTVDGGLVLCRSPKDYDRGRRLRWFGIKREQGSLDSRINEDIEEWGYKFHMNDVAATMGIEGMKYLKSTLRRHREIARFYDRNICSCITKPPVNLGVYWLYTILLPNERLRDAFKQYMTDNGVQVSQVHRRNDQYKVFKPFSGEFIGRWHPKRLKGLDEFSSRMIAIPVNAKLTDEQVNQVAGLVNDFAKLHRIKEQYS